MATMSGLLSDCSVLSHINSKAMVYSGYSISIEAKKRKLITCNFVPKKISRVKFDSFGLERVRPRFSMSKGGNYGIKIDDEYDEDPFWLCLLKDTIRGLKSLLAFLVEQPGQLKYIEWPSFKDTLRTATLTLILVAALIVALSSIDSALSYILVLILRKPA